MLFECIRSKIYLFEFGRKLRNYSFHILNGYNSFVSDILDANNLTSCTIGVNATIGESRISLISKEIRQRLPDVELHIEIKNNRDIEMDLNDNLIDFALMDIHVASYNISSQGIIKLKQLEELPLLLRENGGGCRFCMETEFNRLGIHPKILTESISNQALINLAEAGFGVGILPESIVREKVSDGTIKSRRGFHNFLYLRQNLIPKPNFELIR